MNDTCFWLTFAFYMMNVITFALYAYDKHQAYFCKWRIPEVVLLGSTISFGSIGAFIARKMFRHKTKKKIFSTIIWIFLPVNILTLLFVYMFCR